MRFWIYLITGAIAGGLIGHSQLLCFNSGQCSMTATWQGGAILGGVLGWALSDYVKWREFKRVPQEKQPETEEPT